jgi:hypothetical protein
MGLEVPQAVARFAFHCDRDGIFRGGLCKPGSEATALFLVVSNYRGSDLQLPALLPVGC